MSDHVVEHESGHQRFRLDRNRGEFTFARKLSGGAEKVEVQRLAAQGSEIVPWGGSLVFDFQVESGSMKVGVFKQPSSGSDCPLICKLGD